MKVPIKWLREYVDITIPLVDLADRLTMAGLEVKGMQVTGGDWENIVIGQIVAIAPHPNADRLCLTKVDLGAGQETIVCGAPNLTVGDKIVFAHVGAQLIDPHSGQLLRLTSAKIRGVVSNGMVCSEKELGISDNHEGIMVLPPEASLGTPLADYLGDTVLDSDVTPNRPDCLSVIGIARDFAALTGQILHIPEISYEEAAAPIDQQISVEIADPDLCSRYCASLITGIKIAESPKWMQQRLIACGMRPINNVVDITNYVMLEYGQPLHAFNYERIRGKKIIVRRAIDGEVIVSLDGEERTLSSDTLVIADEVRAVAIAGVMGGANSEVTERTTSILLESANFDPANIHFTSRQLSLTSEASMRFERGIRPGLTIPALKHATQLIMQLAGGEAARGLADVYPGKRDPVPILISASEVKRLLGTEFSTDQIVDALTSLGFDCEMAKPASEVLVTTPYWRSDIQQEVDLIEEVVRIVGYDKIPTTMLSQSLPQQNPAPILGLKKKVRRCVASYGFQEVITYSLNGLEMLDKLSPEPSMERDVKEVTDRIMSREPMPIRLTNPMTADQEYLRPNLRANLLSTLSANRRHEDGGLMLFELGKVYLPRRNDLPNEPEVLCCVLSGARFEKSWLYGEEPLDFFYAKGIVEGLLNHLGVEASFEHCDDNGLHPAKQAAIVIAGDRLGIVGELHPEVSDAFEISEPVYLFDIDVTALLPFASGHRMFHPIPRFPSIVRDMALVVDVPMGHQKVQDIIRSFALVSQVAIFDVYSGEQVPPGKKSLAYRVVYRSPNHTLTDEEVDKVQQQILDRLSRELCATLRT
ncbi:phenylalanine--tRNA ligase subunit beta [Chloroflexota bacterium]